ncbi:hypothetical protein KBY83_12575 [Cyanobium sp. WKJ7-Wakatipu]|uniref:hypothetical protein n=1 Tax=Cyanobium sp. WKJ7-Wakatipu TaxID=2823726 RepID=UPI0020CDB12B|nr:hypothetical protein [Cyanobium sp. WKJ7-Wakatipu]MCP9784136.1 hypothetical protein [Cyanobium sp. WKJ7-Wakatipu]
MTRFIIDNCFLFALVGELGAGVLVRYYANEIGQPQFYLVVLALALALIHFAKLQLRERMLNERASLGQLEFLVSSLSFILLAWISVIPK